MSNPLEEFFEDYGVKTATIPWQSVREGASSVGGTFGNALLAGVSASVADALIGGGVSAVSAIHDAATKSRDFRTMLEFNSDLHDYHQQNPKLFNQLYTSLRNANPAFAKDPLIAGSYMRRMLDSPIHAGGLLAEVTGSVPAGHGAFSSNVGKAGREAAVGHMKNEINLPFNKKQPPFSEQLRELEAERALRNYNR